MSIKDIQEKLRQKAASAPVSIDDKKPEILDYSKLPIDELQKRYDILEKWMKLHKDHPKFYIAQVRLKQMNVVLAKKIKM